MRNLKNAYIFIVYLLFIVLANNSNQLGGNRNKIGYEEKQRIADKTVKKWKQETYGKMRSRMGRTTHPGSK